MSQNNTSSNETNWSFVAPARPSDTPGSGDSGGGGTTSWMALSSSAHSGTSAGHGQITPRGRPQRSSSARSARCLSRPAVDDRSNVGPSANITWSNDASPSAGTATRKSSKSAARAKVSFASNFYMSAMRWTRVRKLGLDLKERVNLFVDALRRRNEAMCEMESYSNYNFDMCQQYVSTEVDCMRESDEGSTLRIMDPGRRNELAEDGARHIYHSRK